MCGVPVPDRNSRKLNYSVLGAWRVVTIVLRNPIESLQDFSRIAATSYELPSVILCAIEMLLLADKV
jgi:hypothetical protein